MEKILTTWKKKTYKPVYWIQGDEDYYIDQLITYAETSILPESEASFNLTVFYGRDADWAEVVNTCMRYPMFSEKQVIILKEAQQMKEIEKLESYIMNPLSSTILIVSYKGTFDKRKKFSKTIAAHAEVFNSIKIKDDKIQEWIQELVKGRGISITPKAVSLLEEHIGNDLSRIYNEIEKVTINLSSGQTIDEDHIEKFIGISKEYNIFELLGAITKKDVARAITILNYFEANPKLAPIQMAIPALYAHFSRVYAAYGMKDQSPQTMKAFFYYNPNSLKQAQDTMKNYGFEGIEKIILLMHHYNLKGVGVGDSGSSGNALLKEMVVKMIMN